MDTAVGPPETARMKKLLLVLVIGVLVALFFLLGLGDYFTLDYLKQAHERAVDYAHANPVLSTLAFFGIYVLVTALSLPGAAVMTLAAGAVFGLIWGTVMVSFASSVGATAAMLIARMLLGDWVQRRFASQLSAVNDGLARDGAFYLFSIRMVPIIPFFVVNLVLGMTRMPWWRFYWVSQTGMLAGTLVYVFAGTQLASIESPGDVLSPGLILALSLLGLFPLLARKAIGWIETARTGS
jgi:uncharacterized membrane protein YdjX (TVP38/TMEM64 family)